MAKLLKTMLLLVVFACAFVPDEGQACGGDCNADGQVTVDEVVRVVGLSGEGSGACPTFGSTSHSTIEDSALAVREALVGCSNPGEPCTIEGAGSATLRNAVVVPTTVENLEAVLGTTAAFYGSAAECVPVSIVLRNGGSERVSLSETQTAVLSVLSIGIYDRSRLFEASLQQSAGVPIGSRLSLAPGESVTLSVAISLERLQLYTVPPFGGGAVRRTFDVYIGFGVPLLVGVARVPVAVQLDFGILPTDRAFEFGAGELFSAGKLLVGFREGVALDEAEAIVMRHASHISEALEFRLTRTLAISIPFERTTGQAIREFVREPSVAFVQRDYVIVPF